MVFKGVCTVNDPIVFAPDKEVVVELDSLEVEDPTRVLLGLIGLLLVVLFEVPLEGVCVGVVERTVGTGLLALDKL